MDAVPHTSFEPSVDYLTRWVAKVIDLLVAAAMARLLPPVGIFAAVTYLLIADGVRPWGSAGKYLLGLAVRGSDGSECSVRESIVRNAIVAGAFGIWCVLQPGGWFAAFVGWVALLGVLGLEAVLLVGNPQGRRLGDELADTRVVQARVTRNG